MHRNADERARSQRSGSRSSGAVAEIEAARAELCRRGRTCCQLTGGGRKNHTQSRAVIPTTIATHGNADQRASSEVRRRRNGSGVVEMDTPCTELRAGDRRRAKMTAGGSKDHTEGGSRVPAAITAHADADEGTGGEIGYSRCGRGGV